MSAVVRDGFKRAEVGEIPIEWERVRLTDVAQLESGHTPSRRQPSYWGGGIPWVSLHDTEALDAREIFVTQRTVTSEGINNSSARLLPKGTVVFSRTATVGKATVLGCEMATSQDFANYICGPRVHNHFLVYLFRFMGPEWKRLMAGSIHNTVYMPVFEKLRVTLPPRPEQEAIAAALSDADALLAKLDALIAKKRDLKQAVMQQLLTGQIRLPGFSGEWEVRPLASVVANLEAGVSVNSVEHAKPLSSGEPCILKTSAIGDGQFDPEQCKLIDRRDISRAKVNPRRDTIIISRMNTPDLVGEVGYVPADFPTLCLPDRLWMTRFDSSADLCARWLAYVMSSTQVTENIKGLATGTSGSMKNIGKSALLGLELEFPTGEEQTAIATILSDMDAEIAALEARRDKTRALKQGMMQELLTGRIRLV